MKLNRGYKVRIFPTNTQIELIEKTFGCVRLVWNYSLMEKKEIYMMFKGYPELLKSHKYLTSAQWKKMFPFLGEVDSQALSTTQQELRSSFSNFYKGSHNHPNFKSKKNSRRSYTTHTTNNNIRVDGEYVKLPKLKWVKLKKKRRDFPDNSIIKAATISKTASGKYYVSLRIEYEQEIVVNNKDVLQSIGLDFSMPHFYIDNEGKKANFPQYILETEHKIKKIDRILSKKLRGSKHRERSLLKRAKLYEKKSNQLKDFQHQLSRRLVNTYDIITVETLSLKEMNEYKEDKRKIQRYGYHQFLQKLQYKCDEVGKLLHKVDKYYASSKICSVCNQKKKTLARAQRVYVCECGSVIDRDINAAINLATQGIKQYLINTIEDRTASIAW